MPAVGRKVSLNPDSPGSDDCAVINKGAGSACIRPDNQAGWASQKGPASCSKALPRVNGESGAVIDRKGSAAHSGITDYGHITYG